jgi:hypothetical protein
MTTLRRIHAATIAHGPSYWLCVLLSAYVSMKLVAPGVIMAYQS